MPEQPSTHPDELASLRGEFLRRLGRNLWCFQQVEVQLKALMTVGQGRLPLQGLAEAAASHAATVRTRTLGQLIGDAEAGVFAPDARPVDPPIDGLAWSVRYEAGAGFSEDLQGRLRGLLAERNELVHHATERWDLDDSDGLRAGLAELDEQRERVVAVHATLRRVLLAVHEATQAMVAHLQSSAFRDQLRRAHLDACLVDTVARAARADGWTPLSHAGHAFREHIARLPEDQRQALPKLSRLLGDSGLFELREEPTAQGARTVCRLRATAG